MSNSEGIQVPIRKVGDLKTRNVSKAEARRVKGGPINWPNDPRRLDGPDRGLPAVQRGVKP